MKVSFPETTGRVLFPVLLLLLIWPPINVSGQEGFPINGYYVTLDNDTIYGNLTNQDGMYLVVRNAKGKKHKFTPSQIRGFCLQSQEYTSLFINEMDSKRYVAIKSKGYYTLLLCDINSFSTYGQMGLLGGIAESAYKTYNSGYFVIIESEKGYYSLPSTPKLLRKYLLEHFSDDTCIKLEADKESLSLKSIEPVFNLANEMRKKQ